MLDKNKYKSNNQGIIHKGFFIVKIGMSNISLKYKLISKFRQ